MWPPASVTGIASTSLMSLPPNSYPSTDAWYRFPDVADAPTVGQ